MASNPQNEPFLAPSADSPAQNRKKVLAGKSLLVVIVALAIVFALIWVGIVIYAGANS